MANDVTERVRRRMMAAALRARTRIIGAAWPRAPLARLMIYAPRGTRRKTLDTLYNNEATLEEVCERAADEIRPGVYAEWFDVRETRARALIG